MVDGWKDIEAKIADIKAKIAKERKMVEGLQAMRGATNNADVIRSCEAKIRDSGKMIAYFETSLNELQGRRLSSGQGSSPGAPSLTSISGSLHSQSSTASANGGRMGTSNDSGISLGVTGQKKANYTALDLIKYDTPFTPAKIQRMLHQLEFKAHVESQYKEGIEKMAKLFQDDGDKRSKAETAAKRVESNQKMLLLQQALKKYQSLNVLPNEETEGEDEYIPGDARTKKPVSGALMITIKAAKDIDHAPQLNKRSRAPAETVVVVKVEDNVKARTHGSRTDRWNEDFEIHVDKANEVELALYDVQRQGNTEVAVPIGLLWIRLSDLVEEIRKKKVGQDGSGPGWVTAADMNTDPALQGPLSTQMDGGFGAPPMSGYNMGGGMMAPAGRDEDVDAWFNVEPEGAIGLRLNFIKSNVRKRPLEAGLGRAGAFRKRKEDIHELNGHKFVAKQFYNIVLCAFCREFLLKGAGMQCEDCRYACHAKCYPKVVTKCISKSSDYDKDEDRINHRIPHRFEPITNLGTNFCCHCGMMLAWGRKNARKCTECGVTCHADCAHLVPDFCGMSMEVANKLITESKLINQARTRKPTPKLPPAGSQIVEVPPTPTDNVPPTYPTSPVKQPQNLHVDMSRLTMQDAGGYNSPAPVQSPAGRMSLPMEIPPPKPYQQQQQSPPSQPLAPNRYADPRLQDPRFQHPGQGPASPSVTSPHINRFTGEPFGATPPPNAYAGPRVQYPQSPVAPPPSAQQSIPPPQQQGPPRQQSGDSQTARPPPPQQQGYPQSRPLPPPQQTMQPPYRPSSQAQQPPPPPQQVAPVRKQQRKITLDDFNFLAVLGKGNFGKVMLAEEKRSQKLWAIKVLKKEFIIENDEVESTKSEKRVFLTAARERHPFLLGLHSCFQTETRIYFVMEYVSGGDLMLHIQREQFNTHRAKFYAAEVLLALEYFHKNGIIYRDLKLDNILLTLDGHIKLADYGLCKEEMWPGNTTSTFCGTPEFMAPEILLEQRYGMAVDWWAFGVLIYEMLLGQSPFRGDDEDEIFDAILEDEPLYPIQMPKDSVSILQKLLTRDPSKRLGSGPEDAEEIKRHLFFKTTNWDDVFHKRLTPPYFPSINGATDTSNFDQEFTREQPTLTPVHSTLSGQDQAEFNGFSWVAPWAQ
ncbi:hypothetical protein BT69DRAFT_1308956 [Atractiella rhizophila]|nr:hypothetical protein BT69DRAFT_1308956 [Atractiella rhizophila]